MGWLAGRKWLCIEIRELQFATTCICSDRENIQLLFVENVSFP